MNDLSNTNIYIDADGCPVKEEVYRVARRYKLKVFLVANAWIQCPDAVWLEMVLVDRNLDAADDWIAERASDSDIVITADIPLADRSLKKGAVVIDPRGRLFTADSIGSALANRELMSQLREMGTMTGGPAPFAQKDRSQFLQTLDQCVQKILRRK
ncbi:MAG: YaiI/YqxD family protein [Planctomycetota bacterium]|nr:YaiI/YqxD family protein [Planctomycetota bacterium]